jgi:FtsP/CotA-like multicopper oxidase with cupredoxin domain
VHLHTLLARRFCRPKTPCSFEADAVTNLLIGYPLLLLSKPGNISYLNDPQWNVLDFGKSNTIRLIVRNQIALAHPMYLHGHNFCVLAQGTEEWDSTVVRPKNPQVRDVQMVDCGLSNNSSYIVHEYKADNPGVWPFHCHVAWHVSGGFI